MDADLRTVLRDHQRGLVDQATALRALLQAGFTRARFAEDVEAELRRVFVDDLDYGSLARSDDDRFSGGGLEVESAVLYSSCRGLVRWTTASHLKSLESAPWEAVTPECMFSLEAERLIARAFFDTFTAKPRSNPECARVRVWYPSRLDVLEGLDASLRFSVSAPLRERALVLETLEEAFPSAVIVSSQVAAAQHGDLPVRPERARGPVAADALWPEESRRVHVR